MRVPLLYLFLSGFALDIGGVHKHVAARNSQLLLDFSLDHIPIQPANSRSQARHGHTSNAIFFDEFAQVAQGLG
jgi:hypothetical protein